MVDIETATTRERYDAYLERKRVWEGSLRPAKNAEDREALWRTAPKVPHGDEPKRDKIVSIQFQRLSDLAEGEVAPLTFLKAWEHPNGERGILEEFNRLTGYYQRRWDCVKVGYNLAFERSWLFTKGTAYGLIPWGVDPFEFERPHVDLHHWALLANAERERPADAQGNVPNLFFRSGLNEYSAKRGKGNMVTEWYHTRRYSAIEQYVREESKAFVDLWNVLIDTMPKHWRETIAPRLGVGV